MSLVTITVDNKKIEVEQNKLLIDTLIQNNIQIPYFCYHEALGSAGNCRMCMVEIEGQKRPQIACDTFVKDGMVVKTKGENINRVRQNILELELINHPIDCPICDQAGECKLQDFYMDYGLYDSNIKKSDKIHHKKHIDLGSNVMLDQERCVLCARCTRFTSEITKTHELGIINRADNSCVSVMPDKKLDNPYAMNVVDLCPVGALTSKDFRFSQRVWFLKSTSSICHGCQRGCNIYIDHNKEKYKDDKIYRFKPRKNDDINTYFICDIGRLSYKNLQENRQIKPLLDKEEISDDGAKKLLKEFIKNNENKKIVILIDANLYNEDIDDIKNFAKKLNAEVISPMDSYLDKNFSDDWLKTEYRCANKTYLKDIKESIESEYLIDLLINFNHPDFNKFNAKQTISFQTHQNFHANLILPIPTFSEYSGNVVNIDGVKQYCQQAIFKNTPLLTIKEWITAGEEL